MANSVAEAKPYFSLNNAPHAAPVPCPPVRVIEPAMRPIKGSRPSILAIDTPTMFCTMRNAATINTNLASGFPPRLKLAISAFKPILAKKQSISGVLKPLSNWIVIPEVRCSAYKPSAAITPPTTGSGIE